MFSLRRGVRVLDEDTRRRLAELDDGQALEVAERVQRLKPETAPAWTGLAIYSGRDVLGHVVGDGDRWEAQSSNDNNLIGVYMTWIEATNAIIAKVAS